MPLSRNLQAHNNNNIKKNKNKLVSQKKNNIKQISQKHGISKLTFKSCKLATYDGQVTFVEHDEIEANLKMGVFIVKATSLIPSGNNKLYDIVEIEKNKLERDIKKKKEEDEKSKIELERIKKNEAKSNEMNEEHDKIIKQLEESAASNEIKYHERITDSIISGEFQENSETKSSQETTNLATNNEINDKLNEKSNDKLNEKSNDKLNEKSNDKLNEKSNDKLNEKSNDKLNEKSNDKLNEKSNDKLNEKSNDKLNEKSNDKLNEKSNDKLNDKPKDKLNDKPKDKLNEQSNEKLNDKPNNKSNNKPKEKKNLGKKSKKEDHPKNPTPPKSIPKKDNKYFRRFMQDIRSNFSLTENREYRYLEFKAETTDMVIEDVKMYNIGMPKETKEIYFLITGDLQMKSGLIKQKDPSYEFENVIADQYEFLERIKSKENSKTVELPGEINDDLDSSNEESNEELNEQNKINTNIITENNNNNKDNDNDDDCPELEDISDNDDDCPELEDISDNHTFTEKKISNYLIDALGTNIKISVDDTLNQNEKHNELDIIN